MVVASKSDALGVLAVDATHVYWTSRGSVWNADGYYEGTVMRAPISGGAPAVFARKQATSGPIVVVASNVYWSVKSEDTRDAAILRLRTDACQDSACR